MMKALSETPAVTPRTAGTAGTAPSGPADEPLPRIFGKYTLLRRMATGGMAEIFLALQRSVAGFEKLIVIKRILPGMTQDRQFIDMLLHEARVAATLSHPNIVQTIDVGQVEGAYFIALEHIHGEDLRSIIRQMKKKGVTEFPLEHALAFVLGICAGIAYAHERRDLDGSPLHIVHRDISPQNVVCGFAGDVKIVDFGVAKSGIQVTETTKSGQLRGKIPYMSPEQARGEEIDWRSDIFAIGVMLFELTTGKRLFKGPSEFETLKLIIDRPYPKPSSVSTNYPQVLEAIVMRALEKDRQRRYQSGREMQADLEAFVRDERLPVSSIALAGFMKMLFEEKLAAQKEALLQGRQLADIIASEVVHSDPSGSAAGAESGSFSSSSGSASAAGVSSAAGISSAAGVSSAAGAARGTPTPPPTLTGKASARWALVALPVAAIGAASSLFFALHAPQRVAGPIVAAVAPMVEQGPSRAKLLVASDPAGAHIWINGEVRAETTPATIVNLPIGAIDVKVGKEGYASISETIELAGGDAPVVRTFTLQTLPAARVQDVAVAVGSIVVSARGGWCNVSIDGTPQGATPTRAVEVEAGFHSVTCATPQGKKLSSGATVHPGETARVAFGVGR